MREEKHRLRTRALGQRESSSDAEILVWSRAVQEKAVHSSPYVNADSIVLYSSIGNEVGTEEIRDHALSMGKKLFYPKLGKNDDLNLIQLESAEELGKGPHGILEPLGTRVITEEDQEGLVVFVPGVAFDIEGNRLGRGGGWYDRVLERLGQKIRVIGLAYEFQLVEVLPVEGWDKKMHHIITEERIIDCAGLPSSSG